MKILQILIIHAITVTSVFGSVSSELDNIEKQRLKKIEAINTLYLKQFEKLKMEYMKKGDLASANQVQAKIDSISSKEVKSTKQGLEDSIWTWGSGGTLTLQKNGVARHTSWGHSSGKWRKSNDGTVTITVGSRVFKVTFINDVQGQVIFKQTGAKTTITRKQ